MRGRVGGVGMLLAAVLLVGCAPVTLPDDPTIAYFGEQSHGGDSAALVGVLDQAEGCTVIRAGDQGDWVPVFPPGTAQWDGDALRLSGINASDHELQIGSEVTLGGGVAQDGADGSWVIPTGCASFTQFWRVASD